VRIVIDCNVLVSGFIWPGLPNELLTTLATSPHELYTSETLIAEFERVLTYPKIAKSMTKINIDASSILDGYKKRCHWCYPIQLADPVCRDASDDAVLACALAASADMIISGDDDLLNLRIFENIPILSPANALQILKKDG
jgi:putative PIN family toxin of toxin-antitoxin system